MNKALLNTGILSEIGRAKDAIVAANAKTYRRSFGHFTLSTVSVMALSDYLQGRFRVLGFCTLVIVRKKRLGEVVRFFQ